MARVVYSEEFKIEAVKQVTKNGYTINIIPPYFSLTHNFKYFHSYYLVRKVKGKWC
ncbi:MAG: hypothetical protein GQ570_13165 [Helicobacteraceae bacterium]|nr:hypothetical protein [Helicobacteraceae bacterium]